MKSVSKLVVTYLGVNYKIQPSFCDLFDHSFTKCDNCDLYDVCLKPGCNPLVLCSFPVGFDYFFEKL